MGRNAGKRARPARSIQDHPDLLPDLEEARQRGDEEAIWDMMSEMERRFVAPWPDLKYLYSGVDNRELSEIRETILDEAERRRRVMDDLQRIMSNEGNMVGHMNEHGLVPYTPSVEDLELLALAINLYKEAVTIADFERSKLFASGVNLRLLRIRPDLNLDLIRAYRDACIRLGHELGLGDDIGEPGV